MIARVTGNHTDENRHLEHQRNHRTTRRLGFAGCASRDQTSSPSRRSGYRRRTCPTDTFDRAGYYLEVHCGRNDYGVAILSRKNRKKPRVLQKGLPGQEQLGARLLTIDVDGPEFSSVYAPAGNNKDIKPKLKWFECLTAHVRAMHSRSEQKVLCGDFNVVSECRVGPAGSLKGSSNYREDVRGNSKRCRNQAYLICTPASPQIGKTRSCSRQG